MLYETRFGRIISQFAPGAIVVCTVPLSRVHIAKVGIQIEDNVSAVKYTSVLGNTYNESQLWKNLDSWKGLKRIDFQKGQRLLKTEVEVYPVKRIEGAYFVDKVTKLVKVTVIHAPNYLNVKREGIGWVCGTQILFKCSNGKTYFENAIFETYIEALRACALGNQRRT